MKKEVLNDLYYEQIVLGELNLEDHDIDTDKIERLRESDEEILKSYPPSKMAASIKKRIDGREVKVKKATFSYRKAYIPLSAAAVFLLFFAIFPFNNDNSIITENNDTEVIRLKGTKPSLHIYRGNGEDAELLGSNALVREKDLLQISYDSAGTKYGVIFSIDGRGTVTLHFPDNVYSNTRLDFGGKVFLPYSYELDNAPFFERFFFITSEHEIDAAQIMEKAGRVAKGNKSEMLNLPDDQIQQSIILFKEEVE